MHYMNNVFGFLDLHVTVPEKRWIFFHPGSNFIMLDNYKIGMVLECHNSTFHSANTQL